MANYNTLKGAIEQVVKTNGNKEITGALLQQSLIAMINSLGAGYQFAGVAVPATNPGTPDYNVFYFAGPGTYPNFNNATIPARNVGLLSYDGTWHVSSVQTTPFSAETIVNDIIQLYDGSTPVYPRTRAEAVFFDDDTTKTLDQQFSQLSQNFNNLDKFLWANATDNLDVDTTNKMFVFKNNTYIHIGGAQISIPQNTSVSYASFTTGALFGLAYNNGSVVILPWAQCIGKTLIAAFVLSSGDFARMTFCVLPYTIDGDYYFVTKEQFVNSRQNYLVSGFTTSPINIDNANAKFVFNTLYFRVNGRAYYVAPGELLFSSYSGAMSALALCLVLTDDVDSQDRYTAYLEIRGNNYDNPPVIGAIGHYVVAWFYRSGANWSSGPVVSVYSELPFTIDGQTTFAENSSLYIPVYDYLLREYSVNSDGYFGTTATFMHICTRVNVGDKFIIHAPSNNECRYAFVSSDSFASGSPVPLVGGTSVVVIPTGRTSGVVVVPAGCKYLLVYNSGNARPFNIKRYITGEVIKIDEDIADLKAPQCSLIIGELGNVGADSNGLPDGANAQRAGMLTTVAVPYRGATLHFKLPEGYVAGIRSGAIAQNLSGNDYWFRNNQEYTFGDSANYYRIIFAIQPYPGSSYASIPAEDVMNKIKNGEIAITYKPLDAGVISRNTPSDTRVAAACFLDGTQAQTGIDKFPIFVHTTDIHGDAYRLGDAVKLAKVNNADAVLVTGDVNAYTVKNGFDALERVMLDSRVPVAYCRGNHETYGNSDTSFDVFAKYYSNLATKWGYLKASNTASDKTYYYKDFDAKKIRIIALDPYERNLTTNNAGAFSQAQIDWFIATLKSTPADYGIICILHSPEAYPSNQISIEPLSGKTDFFIEGTPDYWSTPGGISGTPLKDIVDAFISRGTISASFTQTATGGVSETITISGDFTTGVNTGVEFIAWVCGHQHLDLVGVYKNTTNRQVVLNMTCGVCYYGNSSYPYLCNVSDLPRNSIGVSQDAINVYAIDRANKEIRIARIGADMTAAFRKREVMTIPYAI